MFRGRAYRARLQRLTEGARAYIQAHRPPEPERILAQIAPVAPPDGAVRFSRKRLPPVDAYDPDRAAAVLRMSASAQAGTAPLPELPRDRTFIEALQDHLRRKGIKPSEVYRAAGLDRRLYSKITADPEYRPSKDTCIALAIGLGLGLEEAGDMLRRAGYALSHSDTRDLAIEFCFREGGCDLYTVNDLLSRLGLRQIGREMSP